MRLRQGSDIFLIVTSFSNLQDMSYTKYTKCGFQQLNKFGKFPKKGYKVRLGISWSERDA